MISDQLQLHRSSTLSYFKSCVANTVHAIHESDVLHTIADRLCSLLRIGGLEADECGNIRSIMQDVSIHTASLVWYRVIFNWRSADQNMYNCIRPCCIWLLGLSCHNDTHKCLLCDSTVAYQLCIISYWITACIRWNTLSNYSKGVVQYTQPKAKKMVDDNANKPYCQNWTPQPPVLPRWMHVLTCTNTPELYHTHKTHKWLGTGREMNS